MSADIFRVPESRLRVPGTSYILKYLKVGQVLKVSKWYKQYLEITLKNQISKFEILKYLKVRGNEIL